MTGLTDLVTITHPTRPGVTTKVSRAAYRLIWAPEGWVCPEDAAWDGTSVLDRVATIEALPLPTQPLSPVATTGDYNTLTNRPTLGSAASKDTGTGATQVVLGNDTRLTDARTPVSHTHPVAQVTGLHAVATTGAYSDLSGKPALNFDPAGSAAAAQAAAIQRANHTGSQPAASITGLHAVATSGDYNALTNKPTIPAAVVARAAIVPSGALVANTVKNVTVTWPTAMPSATYAIAATPVSTTPNTLNTSIVSQTAAGCVIAIRSTAAVAGGVNLHCIAVA